MAEGLPIDRFSKSFIDEVNKGNVPGHKMLFKLAQSEVIGNVASTTLWDITGNMVWATAGEQLEISSLSTNDNLTGTGARKVLISGMDANYINQIESKDLNGTTPVVTDRTDWIHIDGIVVTLSGSLQTNDDDITLRVVSAGNIRATAKKGNSRSYGSAFVSQADKSYFFRSINAITGKDDDNVFRPRIMFFGSNTWINGGFLMTYQNNPDHEYVAMPRFPEKTSFEFRAKTTNPAETGVLILEIMEVDTNLLDAAPATFEFEMQLM